MSYETLGHESYEDLHLETGQIIMTCAELARVRSELALGVVQRPEKDQSVSRKGSECVIVKKRSECKAKEKPRKYVT